MTICTIRSGSRGSLGYYAEVIESGRVRYCGLAKTREEAIAKAVEFACGMDADEIIFLDEDLRRKR
jgi:aryl-alcohol dehydrogenase-like predicted oxidoreductase